MLISIGETARILGVCTKTLRRYHKKGIIIPYRTAGGHRRYDKEAVYEYIQNGYYSPVTKSKTGVAAIYARVSSHKQKDDLKRQVEFLTEYAKKDGFKIKIYKDIGSGLNDKRKNLRKLVRDSMLGKFDKVYLTYLDRLARFGTRIILDIFEFNKMDVQMVHVPENINFEMALVNDMIALVTSFS